MTDTMREYHCMWPRCDATFTGPTGYTVTTGGKQTHRYCTPTHAIAGILSWISPTPMVGARAEGMAESVGLLASFVRQSPELFATYTLDLRVLPRTEPKT